MEEGLKPPSRNNVIARWRRHREAEEAAQAEEAGAAVAQPDRPAETAVARSPWLERGLAHAGRSPDIHLDNAAEFHSKALKRGCDQYGIDPMYRPPGVPR